MSGLTSNPSAVLSVITCKIVAVDPACCTVDAQGVSSNSTPIKISLPTSYQHPDHKGGAQYMPEIGSYCYVATAPEGNQFILAFCNKPGMQFSDPLSEGGGDASISYANNRELLEPGDYRLSTSDGNQLVIRRGGIVQLSSTSMAQLLMVPLENLVRVYAQRYQMRGPLGEIDWGHHTLTTSSGSIDKDAVNKTPVLVKYSVKETAQEKFDDTDNMYTVELRVGQLDKTMLDTATEGAHIFGDQASHAVPSGVTPLNGVISVTVYSRDTNAVTFRFQVSKDGCCFLKVTNDLHIEAKRVFVDTTGGAGSIQLGSGANAKGAARIDDTVTAGTFAATLVGSELTFTYTPPGGAPQISTITLACAVAGAVGTITGVKAGADAAIVGKINSGSGTTLITD